MKKFFKNNLKVLIAFLFGILITSSIVYAVSTSADSISYKDGTVKDALDDLYSAPTVNKFCEYQDSTYADSNDHYSIGTKYKCYVNDNQFYYFYILSVNNDQVELIMDRNITQGTSTTGLNFSTAMKYIENNNLKDNWINVLDVDLPSVQILANAVGRSSWKAIDSGATWWCFGSKKQDSQSSPYCNTEQSQAYSWLYDYTRDCNGCTNSLDSTEAYGYWTKELIYNTTYAWGVENRGGIGNRTVSNTTQYGVRPVITVLKSNLYE